MSGDTWGVSGPAFLGIYGGLIGLAVLYGLYMYVTPRLAVDVVAWPWRPKPPPPDAAHYDRYTVAFLVGGAPRVAAVAVAGLVPGRVRVDRKGRLSVTDGSYVYRPFRTPVRDSAALQRLRACATSSDDTTDSVDRAPRPEPTDNGTFESSALAMISVDRGKGTLATVARHFAKLPEVDASAIGCSMTGCSFARMP